MTGSNSGGKNDNHDVVSWVVASAMSVSSLISLFYLKSCNMLNFMTQGAGCFFSAHLLFQEVPCPEEFPDDSTVWGVRCPKMLAPSPRSPGGFTSAARLASTPSHKLLVGPVHALEDKGV